VFHGGQASPTGFEEVKNIIHQQGCSDRIHAIPPSAGLDKSSPYNPAIGIPSVGAIHESPLPFSIHLLE